MGAATAHPQEAMIASALRWWRDAGVDVLIDEEPRRWLGEKPAKIAVRTKAETQTEAAPEAVRVHATREALVDWLMTDPAVPEGGSPRRRVGPSGSLASGLMVLVDFPETADADAGHLLSGELAGLFDKMLAAMETEREQTYLASIAPGRPPRGRLDDNAFDALAPLARRHVQLAAPKRLWIMGSAASRALLGMSDLEAHGKLHSINLNGVMIDAVVTAHPRFLTDQDKKRRAWTEMQRLIMKDRS